jgi:HD superfamily phosphohydrolase
LQAASKSSNPLYLLCCATVTRKAKLLDAQLVKANAENSILYDRANKEVMGVFEQLQAGHGVDELRRKLAEEMEESKRWRDETKRLARENAKLKAKVFVEAASRAGAVNEVRAVSETEDVPQLLPDAQNGAATPNVHMTQHEDDTHSVKVKLEEDDASDASWRENLPPRRDNTIRPRKEDATPSWKQFTESVHKENTNPIQQENMPPAPHKYTREDSPTKSTVSEERTMSMLGRGRPRRDDGTATMR